MKKGKNTFIIETAALFDLPSFVLLFCLKQPQLSESGERRVVDRRPHLPEGRLQISLVQAVLVRQNGV